MAVFRRHRETATDDELRTSRLLQGLETAYALRTGDAAGSSPLTEFETAVLTAAYPPPGTAYPPPGHSYPRR